MKTSFLNSQQSINSNLALHLITEELKSRKLEGMLKQIGVLECPFLPILNEPIAQCIGLDTDEAFLMYDVIMQRHAEGMNDITNPSETARRVLEELADLACESKDWSH